MKKSGTFMTLFSIMALLLVILPQAAMSDTFFRQVNFTEGYEMMGQKMPEVNDTATVWIKGSVYRVDMGKGSSILFNGDDEMIRMLNHEEKTYTEIPMSALGDPLKMLGEAADNPENAEKLQMLEAMKQMFKLSAKVEVTDETKKIGDYNCKKYIVDINMGMAQINIINWATEDIKLDYVALQKIFRMNLSIMPGFEDVMTEMEKIKGLTVLTEGKVTSMGTTMNTNTKLIEYSEKNAPDGYYKVPGDYTEVDYELPSMGQ